MVRLKTATHESKEVLEYVHTDIGSFKYKMEMGKGCFVIAFLLKVVLSCNKKKSHPLL